MQALIIILFTFLLPITCFADRSIKPTLCEGQYDILMDGGSILVSTKKNTVLLYQTTMDLKNQRAGFYFVLCNSSSNPINFYFNDLQVTDQWGRKIRVLKKDKLIKENVNITQSRLFWASLSEASDLSEAEKAGDISCTTVSANTYDKKVLKKDKKGSSEKHKQEVETSAIVTTIRNEALRRQAIEEVEHKAALREEDIKEELVRTASNLENYYFESSTIFPGEENAYKANVQISVPSDIEKDLEYIYFHFNFGGEKHAFCFKCGKEKKKWYHFGL